MLAGTLFLIVLLGSAVRPRDIARAGMSSIILNIFRTGREHSVLNFGVCSKYDEYVTTHLLLVHPRVKSCSSLKLCPCLILSSLETKPACRNELGRAIRDTCQRCAS